jgi:hypothetical protein
MSELPREIAGATGWERAVNLAGLLAERGVKRVELVDRGQKRTLFARQADLVAELVRLAEGGGGDVVFDEGRLIVTASAIMAHE